MDDQLNSRKVQLRQELEIAITSVQRRAKRAHWLGICLMLTALICSLGTGIAGLTALLGQKVLGALALVPGAAAIAASRFRLQARSNWHHRKYNALNALRSRLLYQMPVEPTADQIAAIAKERDSLNEQMQAQWQKEVASDWTDFKPIK